MTDVFAAVLSLAFGAQILRIAVPYLLAAWGGTLSERSGVINIALEGKLLLGALAATLGAHYTGSMWIGLACGAAGGVAVAALYGLVVIRFGGDQIVAGVAINLLALGLSRYVLRLVFDSASNSERVAGFETSAVLSNPVFWLVVVTGLIVYLTMARTRFGLRIRAAGEHPDALASAGVSVRGVRWRAVLLAGALAGLGGAWLAMSNSGFSDNMSGGRGYIALAAVIMGKWEPAWAAAACLLFAFAEALQFQLQALGVGLPGELVQTLPWVLTIVALAGFIGRSRAPAALGIPRQRE
jgi:simple sugar transport system permease protein